ncbi:MAG: ATP-binding protein [Methanobacteriota archaeon]
MAERENALVVLKEWFESDLPEMIEREVGYKDFIPLKECLGIVGARRAGKTFFMFQLIKEIAKKGNIVYVNLEDRRLMPLTEKSLDIIYEAFVENFDYDKKEKMFFFLDEVQNVPSWERFVRNFYDKNNVKFFVSGSSSKILKSELSALLTGRIITLEMYPFSFREFLKAKGYEKELKDKLLFYSPKIHEIKKLFREYLELGGFPECVLAEKENIKLTLLREYLDGIINRDVLSRYKIKNRVLLENLVNYLFSCISSPFSFSKAYKFFKSQGIKVGKQTLIEYFSYFNQVFLFFSVPIFSYKIKDALRYPVKIYCIDNGFFKVAIPKISEDFGRLAENLVFIELRRNYSSNPLARIFYWKDKEGREVDFVIKEGLNVKQLIQACWNISDLKTKEREIKSLLKAMKEFKLKEGFVITEDYDGAAKIGDNIVQHVPLWKWLLLGYLA